MKALDITGILIDLAQKIIYADENKLKSLRTISLRNELFYPAALEFITDTNKWETIKRDFNYMRGVHNAYPSLQGAVGDKAIPLRGGFALSKAGLLRHFVPRNDEGIMHTAQLYKINLC